jgi:capsule polysaccharide export protein KpsE/RkpR
MANAYVDELHRQNSRLAFTTAGQRRLFFEDRVRQEKDALADAEEALKNMQQVSGLVYPAGQSDALLRSIAQLRAEISMREVQAQAMRLYAAPENPQLRGIEEATSALHAQLDKLEKTGEGAGDPLVPARKIPEAGLEYLRKARDVKYHETLFGLLSQQAEAALLDEARESPVVQVVDRAEPPDKKSWPPRAFFVILATALAAMAASAVALSQVRRAGVEYARF